MKRFFSVMLICIMGVFLNGCTKSIGSHSGIEKAKKNDNIIDKEVSLFGVNLKGATRDKLQKAIKKTSAKDYSVGAYGVVDLYDMSNFFEGSYLFSSTYTLEGDFAFALYTFPYEESPSLKIMQLKKLLFEKYGFPTSFYKNAEESDWLFSNKILLSVRVEELKSKIHLSYTDLDTVKASLLQLRENKLPVSVNKYEFPKEGMKSQAQKGMIFGLDFESATREEMQKALKLTKLKALTENVDPYMDGYSSEEFFKGSQKLYLY
ncbi:hypothetical protein HON22_00470, partial [Candidatus Peregrinibacteria bacterium]|nr:hypothetical protein [Candidatus Peregrinibacteria bacterium]